MCSWMGISLVVCEGPSVLRCKPEIGYSLLFNLQNMADLHHSADRLRLTIKHIMAPVVPFSQHNFSAHLSPGWECSLDSCHQLVHDTRLVINCLISACLHFVITR